MVSPPSQGILDWARKVKPGDVFLWLVVVFCAALGIIVVAYLADLAWMHG